jgi:hypothetical protein
MRTESGTPDSLLEPRQQNKTAAWPFPSIRSKVCELRSVQRYCLEVCIVLASCR